VRIARIARERRNLVKEVGGVVRIVKMETDWGLYWSIMGWCGAENRGGGGVSGWLM